MWPWRWRLRAIDWDLPTVAGTELFAMTYPDGEMKELKAIQETVPVYQEKLRLARDVHMLGGREWPEELKTGVPLKWTLILEPHDLIRVPENLRRAPED